MNTYISFPNFNGNGLHIGIVYTRFNEKIGKMELESCLDELNKLSVNKFDISITSVPGALEIGIALSHMIKTSKYDALIALGAVVRGETYHFEIVSNEVASVISNIILKTGIPIANGVLTVDTNRQGIARAFDKGCTCAKVAVEMANFIKKFGK